MGNIVGEMIKKKRIQHKLTLEQVAQTVGVTKATIQRYESGSIQVRRDKLEKLAKVFNTTPGVLMGWEKEKVTEIEHRLPDYFSDTTEPIYLSKNEQQLLYLFRTVGREEQDFLLKFVDEFARVLNKLE